mgnify:CR=1 FL=1
MKKAHILYALPLFMAACDGSTEKAQQAQTAAALAPQITTEADKVAGLEVSNPSAFARPDTLVSLSLNELGVVAGPLQVWEGSEALPTQLVDDDGDHGADRLVFLANLDAAAMHRYVIDRGETGHDLAPRTHAEVSIKEGGEWQDKVYVGWTFRNVDHVATPPQ